MIESGFRSLGLKWSFNPDDCNNWILKTFFGKREVSFRLTFPEQATDNIPIYT